MNGRYIVVMTEYLTRWVEAVAIKNKTGKMVTDQLINKIYCRYGAVQIIQTDQGSEFTNSIFESICNRFNSIHIKSTPYMPQTNGLTERFNRTVCSMISKYINEENNNWDEYIDSCVFAYNTSKHKSSNVSPYYAVFGRDPVLIPDVVFRTARVILQHEDIVPNDIIRIESDLHENISKAQKVQKEYFDRMHTIVSNKIGDIVKVKRYNAKKMGDKFVPKCFPGIFKIES